MLREHLQMAYAASGIMQEPLASEKEIPTQTEHVWRYFVELHSERNSNGMSLNRITSTTIKDWCELNRIKLELWEIRAIKTLDNLWMESINDR